MTVPSPRFPWWLRALDSAGDGLRRRGALRHLLDPDALLAEAAAAEGHERFGDGTEAMLRAFCASLEADARLAFHGRLHLHGLARTSLQVRLRLEAARARDPAIDRPPSRPPLLVCGLPRSGTTLLHRLLALADDARPLLLWELMEPIAGRGPDRRRQEAERKIRRLQRIVPLSLDAQHFVRADLPDEDGHLLKPSFASSLLYQAPALTWLDRVLRDDLAIAYRNWRALLVLLEAPARRLVLKDPFHARQIPRIVDLIPQAMVVRTHRDPAEVVPSFHKLTMTMHAVTCTSLDAPAIVEANTRWLESITDAAVAPLGDAASRVIDVDYRALLRDPVGTTRSIHARFDLPWSDALEARVRDFVGANRQRRHGDNPYDAAEFGQTIPAIHERFAAYRRAFGLDRG
ncbi:MAG: sulfotransferase [Myxococcales bacterium]|nr:sulfotransferase [Myxococcales bacterium]